MKDSLNSFYFSHDTAASHDPKLITLRVEFGYKALGMYWNIIEAMHREESGKLTHHQLHIMVYDFYAQEEIRTRTHIDKEAEEFEKALFDTGVLQKDECGKVFSVRVLKNLDERREKSDIARANIMKRWEKENVDSKPKEYGRNTNKNTDVILERKGKERKVKEKKERDVVASSDAPTPAQTVRDFFTNDASRETMIQRLIAKGLPEEDARREVKKFCLYWTEQNKTGTKERWELEKTFELRRRLTTWLSNFSKFSPRSV